MKLITFGNAHPYLFSYGGGEIHPDYLSPDIKTSTINESSATSETKSPDINNTRSILSIKDIQILHTINIFPQNRKDELQAYKRLNCIDMQIHTIPKPPHQKIHDMVLSNLHEEESKCFPMEYISDHDNNNTPKNDLD
jgi:hypothetical protein